MIETRAARVRLMDTARTARTAVSSMSSNPTSAIPGHTARNQRVTTTRAGPVKPPNTTRATASEEPTSVAGHGKTDHLLDIDRGVRERKDDRIVVAEDHFEPTGVEQFLPQVSQRHGQQAEHVVVRDLAPSDEQVGRGESLV